ncbi:3232_t:CDS:2, partial [Dentiscutata erythropus]
LASVLALRLEIFWVESVNSRIKKFFGIDCHTRYTIFIAYYEPFEMSGFTAKIGFNDVERTFSAASLHHIKPKFSLTMISALLWIRKGATAEKPEKYELDDKEYERISKLTAAQLEI